MKGSNLDKEFKGSLVGKESLNPESIEECERRLHEIIIGQDSAVKSMAELYLTLISGVKRNRLGPLSVQYFAGPSGVGKTELVYVFAKMFLDLNRSKDRNIRGGLT